MVQRRPLLDCLALLLALGSLATAVAIVLRSGPGREREAGRNVLLITVDTLRADALGAYGKVRRRTPWIDRLAAAGVRFDDAHAHNVADASLPRQHPFRPAPARTRRARQRGLPLPLQHRNARHAAEGPRLPHRGLRQRLPARLALRPSARLRRLRRPLRRRAGAARVPRAGARRPGDGGARAGAGSSAGRRARSSAGCTSTSRTSRTRPPSPSPRASRAAPIDGEVAAADAALGPLLEPILARGTRRPHAGRAHLGPRRVARRARRGDPRHLRLRGHAARPARPLSSRGSSSARGRRSRRATWTCCRRSSTRSRCAAPEGLPGRSLLGIAAGRARRAGDRPTSRRSPVQLNRGWAPLHGVIRDRPEVHRAADPGALRPARATRRKRATSPRPQPARLERLRALLAPLRAADAGPARSREDAATLERLASLGYLGSVSRAARRSATPGTTTPSASSSWTACSQDVVGLYASGRPCRGPRRCRALVRERPGHGARARAPGPARARSRRPARGIATLRRAVALNPQNTMTATLLGGRPDAGRQAARGRGASRARGPRAPSPTSTCCWPTALAAARLGRRPTPSDALERARELDPQNARGAGGARARVRLMAGDATRRATRSRQALAQNPRAAQAESSLAHHGGGGRPRRRGPRHFSKRARRRPTPSAASCSRSRRCWPRPRPHGRGTRPTSSSSSRTPSPRAMRARARAGACRCSAAASAASGAAQIESTGWVGSLRRTVWRSGCGAAQAARPTRASAAPQAAPEPAAAARRPGWRRPS